MQPLPVRNEPGGWRGFSFRLMADEEGKTILISNEIVQAYLQYLADCRVRNAIELSFGDWISGSTLPAPQARARV